MHSGRQNSLGYIHFIQGQRCTSESISRLNLPKLSCYLCTITIHIQKFNILSRSVLMCFARISEDRAHICQYIIIPSVFITEAEMVYYAIRPGYLNADQVILIPDGVNKLHRAENVVYYIQKYIRISYILSCR
jgi:hypothetical protein